MNNNNPIESLLSPGPSLETEEDEEYVASEAEEGSVAGSDSADDESGSSNGDNESDDEDGQGRLKRNPGVEEQMLQALRGAYTGTVAACCTLQAE